MWARTCACESSFNVQGDNVNGPSCDCAAATLAVQVGARAIFTLSMALWCLAQRYAVFCCVCAYACACNTTTLATDALLRVRVNVAVATLVCI